MFRCILFFPAYKSNAYCKSFLENLKTVNRGDMIHILGIFSVKISVCFMHDNSVFKGVSGSHYCQEKSLRPTVKEGS